MRPSHAYPPNFTAHIPYTQSDALTGTTDDVKTVFPAGGGSGKI